MDKKLVHLFKCGNMIIPLYFLKNYKKFKIEFEDFVFLIYLYNLGDGALFNPKMISDSLGYSLSEVMQFISRLSDSNYIELKVVSGDKGIQEEVISLERFYDKLSFIMMDDCIKKEDDTTSCFDLIEKEFGRTLSPMEYEIIKAWKENGHRDELIMEAVKEATFNGVNSLRYIDRILYNWEKGGIKTRDDVEKNRKKRARKEEKEEVEEELFDYNWFEDDENDYDE